MLFENVIFIYSFQTSAKRHVHMTPCKCKEMLSRANMHAAFKICCAVASASWFITQGWKSTEDIKCEKSANYSRNTLVPASCRKGQSHDSNQQKCFLTEPPLANKSCAPGETWTHKVMLQFNKYSAPVEHTVYCTPANGFCFSILHFSSNAWGPQCTVIKHCTRTKWNNTLTEQLKCSACKITRWFPEAFCFGKFSQTLNLTLTLKITCHFRQVITAWRQQLYSAWTCLSVYVCSLPSPKY